VEETTKRGDVAKITKLEAVKTRVLIDRTIVKANFEKISRRIKSDRIDTGRINLDPFTVSWFDTLWFELFEKARYVRRISDRLPLLKSQR
jgi:hypothetical protein